MCNGEKLEVNIMGICRIHNGDPRLEVVKIIVIGDVTSCEFVFQSNSSG